MYKFKFQSAPHLEFIGLIQRIGACGKVNRPVCPQVGGCNKRLHLVERVPHDIRKFIGMGLDDKGNISCRACIFKCLLVKNE